MQKNTFYRPITATPFRKERSYTELAPCAALRNVVCCFWGSETPYLYDRAVHKPEQLVIPDTCVDIIYTIDYTDNKIFGGFCGINDKSFYAYEDDRTGHLVSKFAIRFFAWTAYKFAEDSFKNTLNGYFDVSSRFQWLDVELKKRLFDLKTIQDRAKFAQGLMLNKLDGVRENRLLDEAIHTMIDKNASYNMVELAANLFISTRQLERIFREYAGVSPKRLSSLIRYQMLWKEILMTDSIDIFEAVYKYGFTDQSHLMREFKRFHTMNIGNAKNFALENVANVQDRKGVGC